MQRFVEFGPMVLEKKIFKFCLGKGRGPSFEQTWRPFTQGCFVWLKPVVLEKMTKMWRVTTMTMTTEKLWSGKLIWAFGSGESKKKTRVTGSLWKVDFRNPPAWVAVFRGSSNDIYDPWLGMKWIIVGDIIRGRWGRCMCIQSTGPRSFKNNINRAVQWTVKMCRFITRLIVWWQWPWKEQNMKKDKNNI